MSSSNTSLTDTVTSHPSTSEPTPNAKRLDEDWDPNQPIQTLYSQIKEIQTYAQAGNQTFTDHQIVDATYTISYKTGVYYDDCDDWLDLPAAEQTWANFQTHFTAAHRKAKRKQRFNASSIVGWVTEAGSRRKWRSTITQRNASPALLGRVSRGILFFRGSRTKICKKLPNNTIAMVDLI
jgi:hypothetical protein